MIFFIKTVHFSVPIMYPCKKPIIISEPESQTASVGDNILFKVSVSGIRLTFQWYRQDGMAVPGASKPFLSMGPLKKGDFGFYRVRILDSHGEHALSRWVELSDIESLDHSPPAFVIEPKSVCTKLGNYEYLFAFATGLNVTYQWYNERGVPINGATDNNLVFAPINENNFGHYRCLAVDEFGQRALSNWVQLVEESTLMQQLC